MTTRQQDEQADFKARLYARYLTEQVGLSTETVPNALAKRGPFLRRMIRSFFPRDKSSRILDLGCGYGAILNSLREAGYRQVTGVDGSPEMVAAARRIGFADVRQCDVPSFLKTSPDSSYDAVLAFDVLEHFTRDELLPLIDELHRVLAPGGRLVLHVPNAEAIFSGSSLYHDLTHELAFTRGNIHQLAEACRFRVVAVKEDSPAVHGLLSLARYIIWWTGCLFFRLMVSAETGTEPWGKPLTQNMLAVLERD